MQIKGHYYEANKSERHDAILSLDGDYRVVIKPFSFVAKDLERNVDLSEIEISPRVGKTPRVFVFNDGAVFETLENNQVDEWLSKRKSHNSLGWIHRLESRLSSVVLTLFFVVFFSWGFIQYGVPLIAEATAKVLPTEVNQYMGQGTLTLFDKSYFSPSTLSNEDKNRLLNKFNTYTSQYPNLNINVLFRQGGSIGANAFALPDGHIVFTDEMVRLSKDDRELIAILGHEIGHLERRHLLRRVIQDSLLSSLFVLITGDVTYASTVIIAVPAILLELSYSRQFEIEADEFALEFMKRHEIETHYFADIMLRLGQGSDHEHDLKNIINNDYETSYTRYLSTHPVTQERIKPFLLE